MGKSVGKHMSKISSSKYSQKLLDHAKKSAADGLKIASKRAIQKTAEGTADLIGNKIAHKITRVSKNPSKNNSEKNERFILPELRNKIIDDLRLI